ncbi:MAG: TrkH family potassium uptake protein, partial [Oscillospiraceae bacterium]|nr:TrkH family potassium uptake protein [Oscillospiraceae bacterium]
MNGAMILYILGQVLRIEGMLMLPSFAVGLLYGEQQGWVYLFWGITCITLGTLITLRKPKNTMIYLKEGCVATALCWIILSAFGCIPFVLTGEIPRFVDAMFETVSGFTTTGSSILTDVEAMSHSSLFWRSFTHWIGGMGVLVFLLAVLPMAGGSQFNLMKAESPGPSVGKLVPKVGATARLLYIIYFGLTVLEIVLLLLGGMPVFDSIAHSFGTAGTGGFGIKGDSIASYSPYLQWVITIFMILFGVNFNAYYF